MMLLCYNINNIIFKELLLMQGIKPCYHCPYDYKCDKCPEDIAMIDPNAKSEANGFYSQEVRRVKDKDGNEHFVYSHPE